MNKGTFDKEKRNDYILFVRGVKKISLLILSTLSVKFHSVLLIKKYLNAT